MTAAGFREILFDPRIGENSEGGARWSTDVVQPESPNEMRNRNWENALWEWDLKSAVHTREQWEQVFHFFMGVAQGRAYGFRWKARDFYQAVDSVHPDIPLLGTGDGTRKTFQLKKTFGASGYEYLMPVNKPVGGTVEIYIDGVEIAGDHGTYGWSVDETTGLVTFNDGAAIFGKEIYCYFEFHFAVRFDTDYIGSSWVDFNKHQFDMPVAGLKPVDYAGE